MHKQIVVSVALLAVGILLGWFAVVNWQLQREIKRTTEAVVIDSQELTKIEKYLQDIFAPIDNKK